MINQKLKDSPLLQNLKLFWNWFKGESDDSAEQTNEGYLRAKRPLNPRDINARLSGKKMVGQFTPMQDLIAALRPTYNLEDILYKATLPNYVEKITLDLSEARTQKPLSNIGGGEKLFRHATWYYLKVLVKGTGNFVLIFKLPNGDTVTLNQDEVIKGASIYLEWIELKATNTAQPGETNPVLWLERRDIAEV